MGNDTSTRSVSNQAIVWLDDIYASVLNLDGALIPVLTIRANVGGKRPNEPASRVGGGKRPNEPASCVGGGKRPNEPARPADVALSRSDYFHRVARALDVADEILVVGPSATKQEFVEYMHKNEHAIDPRILGVETIAHPSDALLLAFAKLYFAVGGPRRSGNGSGHDGKQ